MALFLEESAGTPLIGLASLTDIQLPALIYKHRKNVAQNVKHPYSAAHKILQLIPKAEILKQQKCRNVRCPDLCLEFSVTHHHPQTTSQFVQGANLLTVSSICETELPSY